MAVDNANFEVPSSGYTIGLVGESGSGKTTLGMSILNLIDAPGRIASGKISYQGRDVLSMSPKELRSYRWQEVSVIFQSAMNALNPVKTISSHITEVLREHTNVSAREADERATKLLSDVGIKPSRKDDFPHELSGGMKQRVVIAMALALAPKLLIADEPTSALDVVVQKEILSLIKRRIKKENLSLIFITHEISILPGVVENIAVMYQGEIVERGPIEKVLSEPLHPYTEMLLDSLLTLDSEKSRLFESVEAMAAVHIGGCKYANACRYAFERCKIEKPELKVSQKGRLVACHKYN